MFNAIDFPISQFQLHDGEVGNILSPFPYTGNEKWGNFTRGNMQFPRLQVPLQ